MKYRAQFFLLIMLFLACNSQSGKDAAQNEDFDSATQIYDAPKQTYEQFKDSVSLLLPNLTIEARKQLLFDLVFQELPQYWLKTPWDFNGTTQKPREGVIACGYFVTNTLSDLGFKINRIKLAQVASSEMINTLCVNTKWITGFDSFAAYMKAQSGSGIYIVGLDFHTGYIVKHQNEIYFFHSNYINAQGVVLERIEESIALQSSGVFFIGNLSANETLLNLWGN